MNAKELGYDSNEELYFDWWLEELIGIGLVKERIYQPEPFELSDKVKSDKLLLREHIYTPDFKIIWNEYSKHYNKIYRYKYFTNNKAIKKLPIIANTIKGDDITIVEVKPEFDKHNFDKHNMERLFRINQKWVYQKFDIYIQLIKPFKLFRETFYPVNFLATKIGRKIKKYKLLNDYFEIK